MAKTNLKENVDIFCKNKICPVCNSQNMQTTIESEILSRVNKRILRKMQKVKCQNNCYWYENNIATGGENVEMFVIFNEPVQLPMFLSGIEREVYYKKVREKIQYWRKNERYLLEILD